MKSHKSIYQRITIFHIGCILANKPTYQCGTIDKHSLISRRRTQFVGFSPIRKGLLIILLLKVLLVIGQILYTFSTVGTIFTLSLQYISVKENHNCRNGDNSQFSHSNHLLKLLFVPMFSKPNIMNIKSYRERHISLSCHITR